MGLEYAYLDGQTPLDEEEKEGLLLKTITSHGELDEFEQLNIEKAIAWTMNTRFKKDAILTEKFIRTLHKRMFDDVWKWAGEFRRSEKNIGVAWVTIGMELRYLLDDTAYWINNKTYPQDEIAIRFKHRLVNIHCFPNGNGRHSRIMADIIMESIFGEDAFTWNRSNMVKADATRKAYIAAIRAGDKGDITPLLQFAKS
ncbi:mobile mystery protein B [Pontibacter sp. HSC-14F20]|uniref:mobile mystery protein B n=1 Tax=Pontibacter sp. HSC-14F20 TaxID=2864136 RepID=UPI001C7317DF|nr:mobile mystery protein B [Pontibacter sp. HSC-14F20]MBX0335346.1 mobile mystery protein B [Pontibacter sp. HSC-14F20]